MLKALPSPGAHTHQITTKEFTILGDYDQPDFGLLTIFMVPNELCIELKSFKKYLYQFRNKRISYERVVESIYSDLLEVYNPDELEVEVKFEVRGGLSSTITKNLK